MTAAMPSRPASVRDGEGVLVRPLPDTDVGRRFPEGGFQLPPLPGTVVERVGGDELLFADGRSRNQPFLCLVTAPAVSAGFRLTGRLISESPAETAGGPYSLAHQNPHSPSTVPIRGLPAFRMKPAVGQTSPLASASIRPADSALAGAAARLGRNPPLVYSQRPRPLPVPARPGTILRRRLGHPRRLSGTGGAAPGPRPLRADPGSVVRVFRPQNADGDWPQWFMFFDRERNIRPGDSHGDIVYWPVLALAQYLSATGDASAAG